MSRVLFIGNSHLACVKVALGTRPQLLGVRRADYMAFSQNWAGGIKLIDGVLQGPRQIPSDVILSEARLHDYDCVVIIGMGLTTIRATAIYLTHRLLPHHKPGKHLLSEYAFEAAMTEGVLRSGAGQLLRMLRPETKLPILVVPEPFMNASIRDDEERSEIWTEKFTPFLVARYLEHVQLHLTPLADVLAQPPQTIEDGMFTQSSYGRGGLMDAIRTRKDGRPFRYGEHDRDYRHMNERYGELVCREIIVWLESRGL